MDTPCIVFADYDGMILHVTWSDDVKERYTMGIAPDLRNGDTVWNRLPEMQRAGESLEKELTRIARFIDHNKEPYRYELR